MMQVFECALPYFTQHTVVCICFQCGLASFIAVIVSMSEISIIISCYVSINSCFMRHNAYLTKNTNLSHLQEGL
jgi:hypothetical protein